MSTVIDAMGKSWTSTAWVAAALSIPKRTARARLQRLWRRGAITRSRRPEKVAANGRREFTWRKLPDPYVPPGVDRWLNLMGMGQ